MSHFKEMSLDKKLTAGECISTQGQISYPAADRKFRLIKLSPRSGSVALRQLNPIHKKGP